MNVNTDEHADEEAAHPAAGVGGLYDRNTELVDGAADGNIHFGYWEGDSDSSSFLEATDRLTDLVAERVPAGSGRRLLDVGCGTGRPALRLAAASGAHVVGVSISHQEIELAQARAARSGLGDRVRFAFADAMTLPFDDASFDAAWAIESLTHMSDRTEALREIRRTLRPGGRVVISDFLLRRPPTGAAKEIVDHMCEVFQAPSVAGPDEHWSAVRGPVSRWSSSPTSARTSAVPSSRSLSSWDGPEPRSRKAPTSSSWPRPTPSPRPPPCPRWAMS